MRSRASASTWRSAGLVRCSSTIRSSPSATSEAHYGPTGVSSFSLADPDAVRRILDSAGFADVTFDEVRASVYYGSDVDAAFEFVSGFAMVQETAARLDVGQREHALDRLRHLLAAHRRADGVWFDSRAWIVAARRL